MTHTLSIFVDELLADEEFREAFFRNPLRTVANAADWGLPLCESEVRALMAADPAIWDRVAEELTCQLQEAA